MERLVNFVKQNVFYFTYGIGITGIATLTLYFQQQHIITIDSEHYYTLTVSNFLLYLMTMISYIQCICIKHTLPPYIPQPRIKHQLKHNHQLYTYINYCDKQNKKYKPPRASHCHIDGCVARFDHHCPFIDNCVGIRNLKAFLLLGGYGAFSGLQFLVLSVFHYAKISTNGVSDMTEQQLSFWLTLAIIDFFMTLALFSLFFGNLFTLTKNITKIDMLKGTFIVFDKEGMNPNPYDLGFLTNYALIFEGQLWKFWWPSELIPKYDGIKFEMIPTITSQDKKVLFANIQQMLKDPLERSIPSTMNQLIRQQNGKHKNIIYHHSNQTYEIPIHSYPQTQKIQQKAAVLEEIAASSFQDVQ